MKRWFLLLPFALVLMFTACGKGKTADPTPNPDPPITQPGDSDDNGDSDENTPPSPTNTIQINQSIMIDPIKVLSNRNDFSILDSLIRYVNYTPKNAELHLSIFLFSYRPLVDAVKKAYDRGVKVNLIIDYSREESIAENNSIISELSDYIKAPSKVIVFVSDAGSSSINHDKYVIFSQINLPEGKAENLVFSTSHNFVTGGAKKIQDAIVMTNKSLYDAFLDNWTNISERASSGMKEFTYTVKNIGDSIEAHFFPRRSGGVWDGKETYVELFDRIDDLSTAKIRVIMSDWTRLETAQELTELQKNGADVQVITKNKDGNAAAIAELEKIQAAGGYVKVVDMSKTNIHSKIVLISGQMNGKNQELVCAGSLNFTNNALKNNNEVLLILENSSLFQKYNDYFENLKANF